MTDRPRRDIWKCTACRADCTIRTWPIKIKGIPLHLPPETCLYASWTDSPIKPNWVHIGKNSKE